MYTIYYLQIFQHTLFVFFQKTELAQVFVTFISDLKLFLLFYAQRLTSEFCFLGFTLQTMITIHIKYQSVSKDIQTPLQFSNMA